MRIPKLLLTLCAAAVGAGFLSVRAQDNPAQAAARAALEQKMGELDAPTESQNQNEPVLTNSSGAAPEETNSPAPAMTPAETSSDTEAHAAMEQKLSELSQQQVQTPPPAPALIPPPEVTPLAATPPKSTRSNYPGKDLGFQPIVAPPLPISADKESQLRTLNAKYIANQISPEEYFKQREAILAEPDSTGH